MSLSGRKFDRGISALRRGYNEESLIPDLLIRLNLLLRNHPEQLQDHDVVAGVHRASVRRRSAMGKGVFLNPELLIKAYWTGSSIMEVPISFIRRTAGQRETRGKAIITSVDDAFRPWFKWIGFGGPESMGIIRRLERVGQ